MPARRSLSVRLTLLVAVVLTGCPPTSACPAGLVLASDGRCVASTDGGPTDGAVDGAMTLGDGSTGLDAAMGIDAFAVPDASAVDACVLATYYRDADMDGHGALATSTQACSAPMGYVVSSDDCDDACASCHPGAAEICDGKDNNCDSHVDEGVETTWYVDADHDGHGVLGTTMMACTMPTGYAMSSDDCDDTNAMRYPGDAEICDGIDNDCNGLPDNGQPCVQNAAGISCTTSCGTTGSGTCTATCALPTGAACTPPAETCNGMDENCDGIADEGLSIVGSAVTAITGGATSATQYPGAHLVATASGYVAFGVSAESPSHLTMHAIGANGAPAGAAIPLSTSIAPPLGLPVSIRAAGSDFLIAYGSGAASGDITIARVNATGGNVIAPMTLTRPTGFTGYARAVVADADATNATVYASVRSVATPYTYTIRRYRLNVSGSTVAITSATDVATDLGATVVFDAVADASQDFVAYVSTTGAILLVATPHGDTAGSATALGTVVVATGTAPVGLAIALRDPSIAPGSDNPLGVAWQDSTSAASPTTHFVAVLPSPFLVHASIPLPGGSGRSVLFPPPTWLQIVAVPNATVETQLGHWLVVSSDLDPAGSGGASLDRVWDVLARSGAPTTTALSVPSPLSVSRNDVSLAVGAAGIRLAERDASSALVTRQIGCR